MATKKDLIEAQGFSRRRLLTAFTSGAPGGKELDPAAPLRAVVAGVALTAILILGGVFYGLLRPGLPGGWENNRLILVSDTGARYVSVEGVLYPVINTASARLLMPAGEFSVLTTDQSSLDGIEIGPTIGILGAPDDLPTPAGLINDGWIGCVVGDGETAISLPSNSPAEVTTDAVVVSRDDTLFVIAEQRRYEVDAALADSVLRAVGLDTSNTIDVDGRWLNLFEPGEPLVPLVTPGAGDAVTGSEILAGSVVHPQGSAETERYLMTAEGELAPMSPLAYQLYLLGDGATLGEELTVSPADIASLSTATDPAGGVDWPAEALTALDSTATACAVLEQDGSETRTMLGSVESADDVAEGDSVTVSSGGGALVRAGGTGGQASSMLFLVDEGGIAYPVPGADADIVQRLGYTDDDVSRIPDTWIQFLAVGPELTVEGAGTSPEPVRGEE